VVRYHRPADRRSRPKRWDDAIAILSECLDACETWRDNLPPGLADGTPAQRLDDVLTLRDLVDQLAAANLPKGFGRD
jgi:hypothetical protein